MTGLMKLVNQALALLAGRVEQLRIRRIRNVSRGTGHRPRVALHVSVATAPALPPHCPNQLRPRIHSDRKQVGASEATSSPNESARSFRITDSLTEPANLSPRRWRKWLSSEASNNVHAPSSASAGVLKRFGQKGCSSQQLKSD